jgi:hypothetical protein
MARRRRCRAGRRRAGAGLAEGFAFAVAGDFAEGAVDGADALLGVGDQHAFGGALEHGGGLLQFFLHQVALGDVPGDGQHAVVADRQRSAGHFAQADLPVAAADMAGEVAHEAVAVQQVEHLLAFVEVDPDPQVQRRAVHRHRAVEAGDAAEALVDLQQQAVALARQQQAVGRGVEGLGEFSSEVCSCCWVSLSWLMSRTTTTSAGVVSRSKGSAEIRPVNTGRCCGERHLQVADAAGLQALQAIGPTPGCPRY